jgi:hypothetical protein
MKRYSRMLIEVILIPLTLGIITKAAEWFENPTLALTFLICCATGVTAAVVFLGIHEFQTTKYRHDAEMLDQKQKAKQLDTTFFEHQHVFTHVGRDVAVKMMPVVPKYNLLIPKELRRGSQLPVLQEIELEVGQMMDQLYEVFRKVIPSHHKIWVAIRDRRSDDCYYTWIRRGPYNPNRVYCSEPMHKDDSSTIYELKRHYKEQYKCVKITGSGDTQWKPQPNDKYHEDRSVMMGAVMTRSWDLRKKMWKKGHNCLSWVITINSPDPDVFNASHIPILQTAIDTFAWLANEACRKQYLINQSVKNEVQDSVIKAN